MDTRQALLGGAAAIALGAGLLTPNPGKAQTTPGTTVTQSGFKADSATFAQQSAGGRTTCTTTQDSVANLTVTITPPAGQYAYITGVYIEGAANATASTSATIWSSTNLTGNPAWLTNFTTAAAANPSGQLGIAEIYPTGLKSTVAGTAVTIVPGATTASTFLCPKVVGFFNPL